MLIGEPPSKQEQDCQSWLQNPLFSYGLENCDYDFQHIKNITTYIMTSNTEQLIEATGKLNAIVQKYMRIALKLCDLIIVEDETTINDDSICHVIIEQFFVKNWDSFEEFEEPIIDVIIRVFLIVLLKHTGLLDKPSNPSYLQEIYVYVIQLTRKLLAMRNPPYISRNETKDTTVDSAEIDLDYEIKDYPSNGSEDNEEIFEKICSITLERCLYLLVCIKGPEGLATNDDAYSDEEIEEKHYVDFYPSNCDNQHFKRLRQVCKNAVNFVCDDDIVKQVTNAKIEETTLLEMLQNSIECHTTRAEARLNSLTQIYELLSTTQKTRNSPTLLSCIYQQLLSGCFGLINLKSSESCTQLHHYTEGIQAASFNLQNKIKEIVHNIYSILIASLKDNPKLQMLTVFALSTRYKPEDLRLVIENGLIRTLMEISKAHTVFVVPNSMINSKITSQAIASLRLLNIIAMSCSMHTFQLDPTVVEQLMDILHEQLTGILNVTVNKQSTTNNKADGKLLNYERNLGDFLVFVRCLASSKLIRNSLCSMKWTKSLLSISGNIDFSCNTINVQSLRPKLLALQLLGTVLPTARAKIIDAECKETIVKEIFNQLACDMWSVPNLIAERKAKDKQIALQQTLSKLSNLFDSSSTEISEDNIPVPDVGFDSEKCLYCSVDNNLTLVHGVGGTGYGLGNKIITSGCYQWKFLIVKENKGNEGTCVGVSKFPISDYRHRTTSDMWLYRAYSGGLYHNGEKELSFQRFTQGDYITVVLDMDAKTLSFGKNGEEPRVAFEDIDATELFPCVLFYGTGPGEKVKMTDMQVIIKLCICVCIYAICK